MMTSRRLFRWTIAFLAFQSMAVSQTPDSLLRESWYWQDQRVGGIERLRSMAGSGDARVRAAAFRALAHRSDTGVVDVIRAGLSDRISSVRGMAAFAAGQRNLSEEALFVLNRALAEKDPDARAQIFDAFGRIAPSTAVDSMVAMTSSARGTRRKDALIALVRAAIRGIRSHRTIWFAFESLSDPDPEVRWRALYMLGRSAPHPLLATEVAKRHDALARLAFDRSADVRMNLATMLARVDVPEARQTLVRLADREFSRTDRDWRVLVQTVRSASTQLRADETLLGLLARGLRDRNDHVVIASAMALPPESPSNRGMGLRDSIRALLWMLIPADQERAPMVIGEAMVALTRFSPSDVDDLQDYVQRQSVGPRLRGKSLEALSMAPTTAGWNILSGALQEPSASVAMAAWDHARRFLRHPGIGAIVPAMLSRQELSGFIMDEMDLALARQDMGISTVVASLIGDSSVIALIDSGGYRQRAVASISQALRRMRVPDDVEAMQSAIQTLGAFGGEEALKTVEDMLQCEDGSVVDVAVSVLQTSGRKDVAASARRAGPAHADYDWRLLRSLGAKPMAVFETERGMVTVDLLPDEAPFTVLSFVRLARSGFFNGLTFHRVVPNFVAQGGDPRGDGWGGPGYALRTEVTARSYERGSVGMASAGRDTEGSQFFFTHLPTPHLDARYTIFARVREGMDVVDHWQVGDVIRVVRIIPTVQRGARSR